MKPAELTDLLASFHLKKALVIGDEIIDENHYCKVRGISAETPTMVLETDGVVHTSTGGAGCVSRNLEALGAHTQRIYGDTRPWKARYWADNYKLLQVDCVPKRLSGETARAKSVFELSINECDLVIVADYRHGLIDEAFARAIVEKTEVPLYVSSQVSQEEGNHHWYSSPKTVFVTNEREGQFVRGFHCKNHVQTLGMGGAIDLNHEWPFASIPVIPVDVCGAGDAFLAAYALSNSLEFANIWAGLSCEVPGANPPTIARLIQWVEENPT